MSDTRHTTHEAHRHIGTANAPRTRCRSLAVQEEWEATYLERMGGWIREGTVAFKEDVWPGLESAPHAFMALTMGGATFGKTLVQLAPDNSLPIAARSSRRRFQRNALPAAAAAARL